MKKNIILVGTLIVVAVCIFIAKNNLKPTPSFESVLMKTKTRVGADSGPRAASYQKSHVETIGAVDQASAYRMQGDVLAKQGNNLEAAEEYKKAYLVDTGSRAVSGLLLAMSYEALGNYNDSIALLDQMIQNGELSANGVKNANEIKSRLLAAKAQAGQTNQTQ